MKSIIKRFVRLFIGLCIMSFGSATQTEGSVSVLVVRNNRERSSEGSSERPNRTERAERPNRAERGERKERPNRAERGERASRFHCKQ